METKDNQINTEKKVWAKPEVIDIRKQVILGKQKTGGDAAGERS